MNSSNFPLGYFIVDWFVFLSLCVTYCIVSGKSSAFATKIFAHNVVYTTLMIVGVVLSH